MLISYSFGSNLTLFVDDGNPLKRPRQTRRQANYDRNENSDAGELKTCHPNRPYAFKNGSHCCKTSQEYEAPTTFGDLEACDGKDFNRNVTICCRNDNFEKCPHGSECFDFPVETSSCKIK